MTLFNSCGVVPALDAGNTRRRGRQMNPCEQTVTRRHKLIASCALSWRQNIGPLDYSLNMFLYPYSGIDFHFSILIRGLLVFVFCWLISPPYRVQEGSVLFFLKKCQQTEPELCTNAGLHRAYWRHQRRTPPWTGPCTWMPFKKRETTKQLISWSNSPAGHRVVTLALTSPCTGLYSHVHVLKATIQTQPGKNLCLIWNHSPGGCISK